MAGLHSSRQHKPETSSIWVRYLRITEESLRLSPRRISGLGLSSRGSAIILNRLVVLADWVFGLLRLSTLGLNICSIWRTEPRIEGTQMTGLIELVPRHHVVCLPLGGLFAWRDKDAAAGQSERRDARIGLNSLGNRDWRPRKRRSLTRYTGDWRGRWGR